MKWMALVRSLVEKVVGREVALEKVALKVV